MCEPPSNILKLIFKKLDSILIVLKGNKKIVLNKLQVSVMYIYIHNYKWMVTNFMFRPSSQKKILVTYPDCPINNKYIHTHTHIYVYYDCIF